MGPIKLSPSGRVRRVKHAIWQPVGAAKLRRVKQLQTAPVRLGRPETLKPVGAVAKPQPPLPVGLPVGLANIVMPPLGAVIG